MRLLIQKIITIFKLPIDLLFMVFSIPSALILLAYRRFGSARLPLTSRTLKNVGLFPIRNHYYEPLFDDSKLLQPLSQDRNLPGINLNVTGQLAFLERLSFSSELIALHLTERSSDNSAFQMGNGSFESGDADYLYQFIRAIKPSKIIEIGSGNSTKIARKALQKNSEESAQKPKHICIEPYEMPWLESLDGVNILRKRVEDCNFDWANELSAGDLLFIDSSHIIRPQGDVLIEFLEIIPQLVKGVYIHIHDIFTPKDYLHTLVVKDVKFWNEQYLLEALLSNTQRYEIVGALNYLKHNHYQALKNVCPYLTEDREPGSFYIKVL